MFIPLLITFRESLEAAIIVGVILGILRKLKIKKQEKAVLTAALTAGVLSFFLISMGSLAGLKLHELFVGKTEQLFEGVMLITSTFFITWVIFWLHKHFILAKGKMVLHIHKTIEQKEYFNLFWLVFFVVFREGLEVLLFLSTVFLTGKTPDIMLGSFVGIAAALTIGILLFNTAVKLTLRHLYQASSVLLMLFAAGMLIRGIGELSEAGVLSFFNQTAIVFPLFPSPESVVGSILNSLLGLTKELSLLQTSSYLIYIVGLLYLLTRKNKQPIIKGTP